MRKIILDCDPGHDDAIAMILAQGNPTIDLVGVTTVAGNQTLEKVTRNARAIASAAGITAPIAAGCVKPLVRKQEIADNIHGESGLEGPVMPEITVPLSEKHGVDFIIETVRANPGEVSLLVIGPVTNIAMAIRQAPDIVPLIKQIVYMGGAFEVRGNTTPAAEMNIWIDPEAARIVMRAPIPQALIPLDVTNLTQLDNATFQRLIADGAANRDIFENSWITERFAADSQARVNVFDTLALIYLLDPSYATKVEELYVDVDVSFGPGYGRTYGYWQEQPTDLLQKLKVVREFDVPRFFELYVDLLTRPVPVK